MTMLAGTRRLVMPPSSNPPQTMDAAWVYLLPRQARVLWLGTVDRATESITQVGGHLTVVGPNDTFAQTGPFDALVVESADSRWVADTYTTAQKVLTVGCVIVQLPGSAVVPGNHSWISLGGRKRSTTSKRIRRLTTLGLARSARWLPFSVPATVRKHASDVAFVRLPDDQTNAAITGTTNVSLSTPTPPRYLMELGTAHGVDFDPAVWAFGPPRGFASQKVIFGLGRIDADTDVIVKLTQHHRFNPRLMAEAGALTALQDAPDLELEVPELLFADEYESVAVICQTRLTGVPLRTLLSRDPDDPIARSGFEATISLSTATVRDPSAGETRAAMTALADDLINIYQPPSPVSSAVRKAAARTGQFDLPSVSMHGDLGVWNMLGTADGHVGVLDWENYDAVGIPLWDLFVYARTLGVFLADASGSRYSPKVFTRQLLGESDLRTALFAHIRLYRRQVDIPVEVVDDLFVMCWVQQAVREAASHGRPTWLGSRATQLLAASLANPLGFRG